MARGKQGKTVIYSDLSSPASPWTLYFPTSSLLYLDPKHPVRVREEKTSNFLSLVLTLTHSLCRCVIIKEGLCGLLLLSSCSERSLKNPSSEVRGKAFIYTGDQLRPRSHLQYSTVFNTKKKKNICTNTQT